MIHHSEQFDAHAVYIAAEALSVKDGDNRITSLVVTGGKTIGGFSWTDLVV
ncbi:hypothetical protein Heshes_23880 [Alicyclobacillus hesperidum]|uniref:Uncharacterized protein n=1 Tax=Alicyclobacillus hesperidum TaxID=89784 RepID=A0AA37U6Z4_9BACL|nr:hypothetical protein Heshes_23880 [Alicyclobacillus hesperidum]